MLEITYNYIIIIITNGVEIAKNCSCTPMKKHLYLKLKMDLGEIVSLLDMQFESNVIRI